MLGYYFNLALRSYRRNVVLSALMVAAIGAGIGTSMTVLTVLLAMSGDPIPTKSSQLFNVQIDNWGVAARNPNGEPVDQLSYRDSNALVQARRGTRQAAMYGVSLTATPPDQGLEPFAIEGRATSADFFAMFSVPFRFGGSWSAADDEARANVVVLGSELAQRLFHDENPVGRSVNLDQRDYRIVGVLDRWELQPRVYDVISDAYAETEGAFVPFTTAIDREMSLLRNDNCNKAPETPGWLGHLNSECVWTQFWVELPTSAEVRAYREFLDGYAAEQRRTGRFTWAPVTRLRNVREWLTYKEVVSTEITVTTFLAFGFFLVCMVNVIGLMLAKFSSRAREIGVRRALGASRKDVFQQCMVEAAVVGIGGGLLGIALTALGLTVERAILPENTARLAQIDPGIVALTLLLALLASLGAGLYPTWRASRVRSAWQL
jgi:putative ABC transport system permease protein